MDLSAAIDLVAKLARNEKEKIKIVDLPDGKYTLNQDTGELAQVYETPASRGTVKLADIASLITWCQTMESSDAGVSSDGLTATLGDITVARDVASRTCARFPAQALPQYRSHAEVPFFNTFMPNATMNVREFIAWLDLIRPGMKPADLVAIDACMASLTSTVQVAQSVAQSGAAINVKTEAGRSVTQDKPFPKRITSTLPFGDPTFSTPCTFSLTLDTTLKGELLAHAELDEFELVDGAVTGPRVRFTEWALAKLSASLSAPPQPGIAWAIMAGE